MKIIDPIEFQKLCWPNVSFYKEQREIIYSFRDNPETFVPAGNELGKDFVAAFCVLWFFCSRSPAKIVTTSVQAAQLEDVLWGELRNFIENSKVKLPIQYNHMKIRRLKKDGTLEPRAELVGKVVQKGEALLGRHLPRLPGGIPTTACIFDEASGISDTTYERSDTWTHRKLIIGNPYPCTNFFFNGVMAGNLDNPVGEGLYRKIIKIKASASPNVRLGFAQEEAEAEVTNEEIVPGVVRFRDYKERRAIWDDIRQTIGLDAEFYLGKEVLLYPPDWLSHSEQLARNLHGKPRKAKSMGVDPAEGGDNTSWTIVDDLGIIEAIAMKTPNTALIPRKTIALMKKYNIDPQNVLFDLGGGGKQHADNMREQGYDVRTVAFGASVTDPKRYTRSMKSKQHRIEVDEFKTAFKNRRAEMFGLLRYIMDPENSEGFAIPENLVELRRQLALFPLRYDGEGKMYLPSKNKNKPDSEEETLISILGHSPDESDSLVLAVYGLFTSSSTFTIGSMM